MNFSKLKQIAPSLLIGIALLSVFIFYLNTGEVEDTKKVKNKNNIVIVLDLSDRVIKFSGNTAQIDRDKELIKHIFSAFVEKSRKNGMRQSKDVISVVLAPQLNSPVDIAKYANLLRVDMAEVPNAEKRLDSIRRKDFLYHLDNLYQDALFSNRPDDYSGADIWKYFDEDIETKIMKDNRAKRDTATNYVFVLTDGCMFVQGKQDCNAKEWQACTKKMPNTKVMVLEISPNTADHEFERLSGLWTRWFKNMGVEEVSVFKNTTAIDDVVKAMRTMMKLKSVSQRVITQNCHDTDNDKENDGNCESNWIAVKNQWSKYQNLKEGENKQKAKADVEYYCKEYLDNGNCQAHAKDIKCISERLK